MYFMYNKHIIILDRLITVAFAIMITLFTFLFCSCLVHVYILTTSPCFVAFLMDIHRANIYSIYIYMIRAKIVTDAYYFHITEK